MVTKPLPDFLTDALEYRHSEEHWLDLWRQADPTDRNLYQWRHPSGGTGSSTIKVANLFPDFLTDALEYQHSEGHWLDLWRQVDPTDREVYHWTHPWVGTGSPTIKDGNPIFSAHSRVLNRGIRIVQQEPLDDRLDIQAYLDFFGGDRDDPESISELVIACTLSTEATRIALDLIKPWIRGRAVEFTDRSGLLEPRSKTPAVKCYAFDFLLPAA